MKEQRDTEISDEEQRKSTNRYSSSGEFGKRPGPEGRQAEATPRRARDYRDSNVNRMQLVDVPPRRRARRW